MKILLIAPAPPPPGGIETVTENLIDFLKTCYAQIDLTLYNTSHRFRPATNKSIIIRLLTGTGNALKTYWQIRRKLINERFDLVHLASSSSLALMKDLLIVHAAQRMNLPIVLHWHFGRIPDLKMKSNWEWKLLCKVIHNSTVSIVIDSSSYNTLLLEGFTNIVNIPNPLGNEAEKKARALTGKSGHRKKGSIVFVGHIIKFKGVFELVEACAHIPQLSELVMIGPYQASLKKELMKLASHRQSGQWLKFKGELNMYEVLDAMAQSSILVLPSYTEGFPLVIIEAMAMGCAVVASDVGAIPEMLGIGSSLPCGICIPPRNAHKLQDAISFLVQNQDAAEVYAKRGLARVLNTYTFEQVMKRYQSVWENARNITDKAVRS